MLTDGRTDGRTNGRTNRRKLARLCLPAKAGATKSKNQELSALFMTHRINAMHALIKFPEYIPYGLGVMARTRRGTYGWTDTSYQWVHALIKFPEYIPYGLGVMAQTQSGTYGRTDGRTDIGERQG